MIQTKDAITTARSFLGTPYAQMDCINLIKAVIRCAPGGEPDYTTAGTNTLWNSDHAAFKYRDLTWKQESTHGAQAGMLAFKRNGSDVHHVGLVTDVGTVIHSSSVQGEVVETPLDDAWNLLAIHRYIETEGDTQKEEPMIYQAQVITQEDPLRVRAWAKTGRILGTVPRGAMVDVLSDSGDGWPRVRYNELLGYASAEYLMRVEKEETTDASEDEWETIDATTLVNEDGISLTLVGRWRVAED